MYTPPYRSESEMLQLVAAGDERAFRQLFHQHWDNIYGVALMLTKSPTLAEDVVQEVFVKVWIKREEMRAVENFSSFVFVIARNHIFDTLRKKSRDQEFVKQLIAYFNDGPSSPEQELLRKESKDLLHKAIESLPEQQRLVYRLSRDRGLKRDEIAAELGISSFTVRNHMAKATQALKEYLSQHSHGVVFSICLIEGLLPS